MIYKGAIYDVRELRDDLGWRGASFRVTSETEVKPRSVIIDEADPGVTTALLRQHVTY